MNNWKSSLLDKFNIGSVTSSERGPGALVKGMILAATVAVGFGAMTSSAYGDEIKKPEPTGFAKVFKTIVHADSLILDPIRDKAIESIAGKDAVAQATDNANIGNTSTGWHVADVATTAMGVAVAAPAMGAWMVLKQADNTYEFIQDKQLENVNLKMSEVSERTQKIYDAEIQKIRDADPAYQQMMASTREIQAEYDRDYATANGDKSATDLEQTSAIAASADLPASTANMGALFPKEKAVEHDKTSELTR